MQKPKAHRSERELDPPSSPEVERIEVSSDVPFDLDGARLDQAAAALFRDYSRARLQEWIRSGELLLDGDRARPRTPVRSGSTLRLSASLAREVAWRAEALPLSLIYEDADLLVVNKPAGLVVHPGAGNSRGTLVNALLEHRPELAHLPRGGIVHRLDKETSGLLVVAASLPAHTSLVDQLQKKEVSREYVCIVRGSPSGGGRVEAPIGRHPKQRTRMAVVATGGKPAITHYRIRERLGAFTALDVFLETGRTHQIRVHMAHRGYPLLGDPVYGGRLQLPRGASGDMIRELRAFRRQALHAHRLRFQHPTSGKPCEFDAPLADDIEGLLATLRAEHARV